MSVHNLNYVCGLATSKKLGNNSGLLLFDLFGHSYLEPIKLEGCDIMSLKHHVSECRRKGVNLPIESSEWSGNKQIAVHEIN